MNYLAAGTGALSAGPMQKLWLFAALSGIFALFGRVVRGVTSAGAIAGALVCFVLLWAGGISAFAALLVVFLLTWLATRFGYRRKERLGIAESRRGRNALQVLANLGSATACALLYARFPNPWVFAAMAAALAEPAADTISSEIGQAFGGTPRLITTSQKVSPGTNGAVTGIGTAAGAIAAIVVAFVFFGFGEIGRASFLLVALSGIAGMIGDSLLGATVEGRARLGNNAVNFISTIIAATIAFLIAS